MSRPESASVPRKRVLITGAEGTIGTVLRQHLADRFELVALTRDAADFPSHVADISDPAAIGPAFVGVRTVVHLAATASVGAPWDEVLSANVIGVYNVFEAARRAGVEQLVFASSNHVIGMEEVDAAPDIYRPDDGRRFDHTAELRPDSLYGVSKVWGEALARYYVEQHRMRAICLRIGSVTERDDPTEPSEMDAAPGRLDATGQRARMAAVWLSHRDCARLFADAIDSDDVRWGVVYGVSANPGAFWDMEHARQLIGFDAQDAAPA